MNSSLRACRTLKDLDLGVIVGYSSRSVISHRMPKGYAGKEQGAKVKTICGCAYLRRHKHSYDLYMILTSK